MPEELNRAIASHENSMTTVPEAILPAFSNRWVARPEVVRSGIEPDVTRMSISF